MLLSAVSVLVVEQSSSEIPEGLMNNPVLCDTPTYLMNTGSLLLAVSSYSDIKALFSLQTNPSLIGEGHVCKLKR